MGSARVVRRVVRRVGKRGRVYIRYEEVAGLFPLDGGEPGRIRRSDGALSRPLASTLISFREKVESLSANGCGVSQRR